MVVAGIGIIAANFNPNIQLERQLNQEVQRAQTRMGYEEALAEEAEARAQARYRRRCTVLSLQIAEGLKVSGLPSNTGVCDRYGFTGVTDAQGNILDIAQTTDKKLIEWRLTQ